ncbi:helix-turn-helix domain-containing protein [Burkholderia sp. LMG 21824]|uniref:helix-turn-helix domain-containing protein n=1 Tax=Burkholderia sp. LMG 21824 TaxID=3158172 RepID=UPI003C2B22BF
MEIAHSSLDSFTIAQKIHDLLESNGIPRHRHVATIGRILNLSASHAHRKMKGASPWTLAQIKDVASSFGVDAPSLLHGVSTPEGNRTRGREAILAIGNEEIPCRAHIDEELPHSVTQPLFVALRFADSWRIYRAEGAPSGRKFGVTAIEINCAPQQMQKPSVAILDDNVGVVDELARYLSSHGFSVSKFHTASSLKSMMRTVKFDAFVVDWIIDTETAGECIRDIFNTHDCDTAVLILTGFMDDSVHTQAIAEIMRSFNIIGPFEKPVRAPVIAAALDRHFKR